MGIKSPCNLGVGSGGMDGLMDALPSPHCLLSRDSDSSAITVQRRLGRSGGQSSFVAGGLLRERIASPTLVVDDAQSGLRGLSHDNSRLSRLKLCPLPGKNHRGGFSIRVVPDPDATTWSRGTAPFCVFFALR